MFSLPKALEPQRGRKCESQFCAAHLLVEMANQTRELVNDFKVVSRHVSSEK